MRVWDVNPGYLNDRSLLGEHRELHGIVVILRDNKKAYSRHPETLRWAGFGWALRQRHRLLRAEMTVRGFREQSAVSLRTRRAEWPTEFIDPPARQFEILKVKYRGKAPGRIRLPEDTRELWAQHCFLVMARDPEICKILGKRVARTRGYGQFEELSSELIAILRTSPKPESIRLSLQCMWDCATAYADIPAQGHHEFGNRRLLREIQSLSRAHHVTGLLSATALTELAAWLD